MIYDDFAMIIPWFCHDSAMLNGGFPGRSSAHGHHGWTPALGSSHARSFRGRSIARRLDLHRVNWSSKTWCYHAADMAIYIEKKYIYIWYMIYDVYIYIYVTHMYIYIPRTSRVCIILAPKGEKTLAVEGWNCFAGAEISFFMDLTMLAFT